MLHYLALGQFQISCPIIFTLFESLQINGHNIDFIPNVISVQ